MAARSVSANRPAAAALPERRVFRGPAVQGSEMDGLGHLGPRLSCSVRAEQRLGLTLAYLSNPMYRLDVNAVQLNLLGRKLSKLADEALHDTGYGHLRLSVRSVLSDVFAHPGSSIGDITERTGSPQSLVSEAVATLREAGALVTEPDPSDRRRTLVRPAPDVWSRTREVGGKPIEPILAAALDRDDPDDLRQVIDALELLAQRLTPRAWSEMTAER